MPWDPHPTPWAPPKWHGGWASWVPTATLTPAVTWSALFLLTHWMSPSAWVQGRGGQGAYRPAPSHAHRLSSRSYVKRMKEFERERRLLQRKKRRERREAEVAAGTGHGEVGPEVAL